MKKNEPQENLSRWLNSVRLSQNIIDSILNLSKDKEVAVDLRLATLVLIKQVIFSLDHLMKVDVAEDQSCSDVCRACIPSTFQQ